MTARWTPPPEFDEYRLERPLGHGGMGQVYLARDLHLDRLVAVKFLLDAGGGGGLERMRTEARALARLHHPNIVIVHRTGEAAGFPYLVSELVRGQTFAQLPRPMPWRRALELGLGLARGLAAAHEAGVLHRDIKATNAMVTDDQAVKLIDFGLAKLRAVAPAPLPGEAAPATAAPTPGERTLIEEDPRLIATLPGRVAAVPRTPGASDDGADATVRVPAGSPAAGPEATAAGALLGTPAYMPPEAWRGEPATAAGDVYSLGVLLHELCTGVVPFDGHTVDELRALVPSRDPPSVRARAPELPANLAAIIDRCLARDPADRFVDGIALRDALAALQGPIEAAPEGNPYRGLATFEAEHRASFHGRAAATEQVVAWVRAAPWTLLAGDSGSGKSSLCRAGVLPTLLDPSTGPGPTWRATTLVPGSTPIAALAAALTRLVPIPPEELAAMIVDAPDELGRRVEGEAARHGPLVVFVDQLEELLTLAPTRDATATLHALEKLPGPGGQVRVLATVRSDHLTRLVALAHDADAVGRAVHVLLPPSPTELRAAIVAPAARRGVRFESEAMVDALVEAGRDEGGLPMVQFALAELWHRRADGDDVLRADALAAMGGVGGALAHHADAVLAALLPGPRAAARRVLVSLVTAEGTRARRPSAEVSVDADAEVALDALVRGRLVVARGGEPPTYELAHEALIDGWQALRDWLDDSGEARATLERLARAAADWERLGRAGEGLWTERRLAELEGLDVPTAARGFVAASQRAVRRRRWRRWGLIVAVPALALGVWGAVTLEQRAERDRAVGRHVADAEAVRARGQASAAQAREQEAAAFAAFDTGADAPDQEPWARAEALWTEAEATATRAREQLAAAARALEAAFLLDPGRGDVRRRLAAVTYERMLEAERAHLPDQVADLLGRLPLWDTDGTQRARWNEPAVVTLATRPPGAPVTLERYVAEGGRLRPTPVALAGPVDELTLPAGSYRFTFDVGGTLVRYPLLLRRGERFVDTVQLPDPAQIPAGFVHVPAGRLRHGFTGDDDLRRTFFTAPPEHDVQVQAFLIGRREVTIDEWISFLEALPAEERELRTPRLTGVGTTSSALELRRAGTGAWSLQLQLTGRSYVLSRDQPLRYPTRTGHAVVRWGDLPVTAVSADDARAYAAWVARTRLPGARMCSALEWERAARGADDRAFPHGDLHTPGDANTFETHGTDDADSTSAGPDPVGAHPTSASPFGVDDLLGNVWELVTHGDQIEIRGGAWYFSAFNGQVVNRQSILPSVRDLLTGVRLCATPG